MKFFTLIFLLALFVGSTTAYNRVDAILFAKERTRAALVEIIDGISDMEEVLKELEALQDEMNRANPSGLNEDPDAMVDKMGDSLQKIVDRYNQSLGYKLPYEPDNQLDTALARVLMIKQTADIKEARRNLRILAGAINLLDHTLHEANAI